MLQFLTHAIEFPGYKESRSADEYRGTKKNPFGHGLLFLFQDPAGDFMRALEYPASEVRDHVDYDFFGVHDFLILTGARIVPRSSSSTILYFTPLITVL